MGRVGGSEGVEDEEESEGSDWGSEEGEEEEEKVRLPFLRCPFYSRYWDIVDHTLFCMLSLYNVHTTIVQMFRTHIHVRTCSVLSFLFKVS